MGPIIKSEIISQNKNCQGIEDSDKSGVGVIGFVLWHGHGVFKCRRSSKHNDKGLNMTMC